MAILAKVMYAFYAEYCTHLMRVNNTKYHAALIHTFLGDS